MIDQWHLLETGYCRVNGRVAYGNKDGGTVDCHATCALLHHAEKGWLLFDTGYAPRVLDATRHFPYSLYAHTTPLHIRPERAAVAQLPRLGLTAADIQTVVVSHFHADHLGGLLDFPGAVPVCARAAYDAVVNLTGLAAVRRAFLPDLMPPDFAQRAVWTETLCATLSDRDHRDLFGDGSCVLVPLPGHAAGQMGLLAYCATGEGLLFVADAAYTLRAIWDNTPFHPLTRLFTDDYAAASKTIACLREYQQAQPGLLILPTHCPETLHRCLP